MNKFLDWYLSGRFLRHPIVVAVLFYTIGFLIGNS